MTQSQGDSNVTAETSIRAKRSHAITDQRSRNEKARRIEEILTAELGSLASKDLLDIGTGAGVIASYFQRVARSVISVDVVDERIVQDFEFRQVGSEALPFEAERFDVVVSNHVIEHVDNQLEHLREIRRVLRDNGLCYLATPNRYWPLERHYRLPFLSWLPRSAGTAYVRLARCGVTYDVQPLGSGRLHWLAEHAGLNINDISSDVARDVIRRRLRIGFGNLVRLLRPFYPSHIVLLNRK